MSNRAAFLDTIAKSEGTYARGDNGYNVLVGGGIFDSYDAHPDVKIYIPSIKDYSTAAGRYQIIFPTYQELCRLHAYTDFTPTTQDSMAADLIAQCGALDDVDAGRIPDAITKCRKVWASFPDAGYGQRQNSVNNLVTAYQTAGGTLA